LKPTSAAAILTILNFLSVGASFYANVIIAAAFGVSPAMDSYLVASSIHIYLGGIFAGVASVALVPVFSRASENSSNLEKAFNGIFWPCFAFAVVLTATLLIFAGEITGLVALGLPVDVRSDATQTLQILMPSIVAIMANEIIAAAYVVRRRYFVPAINKLISPIITVGLIFVFKNSLDTKLLAVATGVAAIAQSMALCLRFKKNLEIRFTMPFIGFDNYARDAVKQIIPLVSGMLIYRALPVFDKFLVSGLTLGTITALSYAEKIVSTLVTLLIGGLTSVTFSHLSADFLAENRSEFTDKVHRIVRIILIFSCPIVTALCCFPVELVAFVFQRGSFDASSSASVGYCLRFLVVTLVPAILGTILAQCFYAAQKNRLVFVLGVVEAVFYLVAAIPLTNKNGLSGFLTAKILYWLLSLSLNFVFLNTIVRWDFVGLAKFCGWVIAVCALQASLAVLLSFYGVHGVISAIAGICLFYAVIRLTPVASDLRHLERHFLRLAAGVSLKNPKAGL
jgi:putative peptidoglycan lipid II flippase